ncbi:M14 family zinc carboxypeptidase [uncultured Dokdonia sp.]|uniref:M14 family zinc carboxypeptidase n=1 Tax=uncultured Dokdonia sp. TaxID=575653 RepID=UPI002629DB90|nr:M14 family zinc carboxypeptidase [uncultured Dokdonia sp.]
MILSKVLEEFNNCREKAISGRYILPEFITNFVENLPEEFTVSIEGNSVEKRPIYSVKFGSGKTKILMWSQMHGNESTTTKSLLDFCNFLQKNEHQKDVKNVLKNCTFFMIPMLNPDGSKMWTRNNANDIDLNRDAQDLSQPESKLLRQIFNDFKPDFCFNLHGQRTIYGFEKTGKPSILSFLAPSANEERDFTFSRKQSASVITHIFKNLQDDLSGNIGLYNDAFNNNCVGDAFQEAGVPTILFEAGHYPNDYAREKTRAYIFASLWYAIEACQIDISYPVEDYKVIPEHSKCYCDIHISNDSTSKIQYVETVEDGAIVFTPQPLDSDLGSGLFAHKTVDNASGFKLM